MNPSEAALPATTEQNLPATPHQGVPGALGPLMLGALGVVYGDIGTSPLYTLKTALEAAGGARPEIAYGMLSLIIWTLIITTSVKYVGLVMRADNDGEGGILALMARLGPAAFEHRLQGAGVAVVRPRDGLAAGAAAGWGPWRACHQTRSRLPSAACVRRAQRRDVS